MSRYRKNLDGTWTCNLCGKIVKELGWSGHNRKHSTKNAKWKHGQKHIDTY